MNLTAQPVRSITLSRTKKAGTISIICSILNRVPSGDKFTFQDIAEEAEAIGAGQVYGSVTRVLKELVQTGQVLEMPVLLSSSRGRPQKAFQFD